MMKATGWPLDYGWGHHRLWTEETDVCLEGRLRGDDIAPAVARASAWLASKEEGQALIDGAPRAIRYEGGGIFYLEEGAEGASVFLHSSGQDAFDALAWYSDELARALSGCAAQARLIWVQHRFDREDHRFRWA